MSKNQWNKEPYLLIGTISLFIALSGGILGFICYLKPNFLLEFGGLKTLRPLHVSAALWWILSIAQGYILHNLEIEKKSHFPNWLKKIQISLWVFSLIGILGSYLNQWFGGREYWEFPPVFALPILVSWLLFGIRVWWQLKCIKHWQVYHWMWLSGSAFFMYIFLEGYLWLIPFFRNHFLNDIAIQWKSSGALVGAWNQLIYGSAFYLMTKLNSHYQLQDTKAPFWMFLLGFTNLCFNWGHHFYLLPGAVHIRWVSYVVSMTEWVLFLRIVYHWRQQFTPNPTFKKEWSYRFLWASEYWVALNLFQALCMSVPALNLYTHGTHITVAHAMGTTIGINSMILLALIFDRIQPIRKVQTWLLELAFWLVQAGLFALWLGLILAGIKKGLWQNSSQPIPFAKMMDSLLPYFTFGFAGGLLLALGLFSLGFIIIKQLTQNK